VGGTVSAAATTLGHYLAFGITAAMMLGIDIFIGYGSKDRWGEHWEVYGPTYMVSFSTVFVLASPAVSCMGDLHWWSGRGVPSWVWELTTYIGFFFLAWGSLWNAHICDKLQQIKEKWAELRRPLSEDYDHDDETGAPPRKRKEEPTVTAPTTQA